VTKKFNLLPLLTIGGLLFFTTETTAARDEIAIRSICVITKEASAGTHQHLIVRGIFVVGPETSIIYENECPVSDSLVWVEFKLNPAHLKSAPVTKFDRLIAKDGRAAVEFEGDFYGPPTPDPDVPEVIQRNFELGWGHLSQYRTQMIVSRIRATTEVPASLPYPLIFGDQHAH